MGLGDLISSDEEMNVAASGINSFYVSKREENVFNTTDSVPDSYETDFPEVQETEFTDLDLIKQQKSVILNPNNFFE